MKDRILGNRRKNNRRKVNPDEHFAAGQLEFTRFGTTTIGQSNATKEQLAVFQSQTAEQFPIVTNEINELVKRISQQVSRLPPDELLQRAWWEFASNFIDFGGQNNRDIDQIVAMRMIDYIQSVLAAIEPGEYQKTVSDGDWAKLKADVTTLFSRLTFEYQICLTNYRRENDPNLDMELEEFRFRAETYWLNVRGKRYHVHEHQALLDVLVPHNDIILRLYGISAEDLAREFDKLLAKHTLGLAEAMIEFSKFRNNTLDRLEKVAKENPGSHLTELRAKIFNDADLSTQRDKVMGELFGMDLFDVQKNTAIPQALVDNLTWNLGEDRDFFAEGDYAGWPLRIWPIMRRPFIRIKGRVFSFDIFSLFDNIYRVLRRAIVHREPKYELQWNDRQKEISEELPFKYLLKILPGAEIVKPFYYRWKIGAERERLYEGDGLLIYADHLFIIEVKAGAFTYTSPANDLSAHLASLKNLLEAPIRQGSRFIDYLESSDAVIIFDADGKEIRRLRRHDFRHVTVCAVTLDAFTELAARAQHLKKIGIEVGDRSVWSISIDDLRVYADIFHNPLVFLHFMEQRMRAGQAEQVDLNDEMDHLGLYFVQNNYSQYAEEISGRDKRYKLSFNGYRSPIDEYFKGLAGGITPDRPRQEMPGRLREIVTFLANSTQSNRSELVSFLLDGDGAFRDEIAMRIDAALIDNPRLNRARPFTVYGGMAMTLYVWSPDAPRLGPERIQHVRAIMAAAGEKTRRLLELEYDEYDRLVAVNFLIATFENVNDDEMKLIRVASEMILRNRFQRKDNGKVGRNEQCPCGSGKKFKRCHRSVP